MAISEESKQQFEMSHVRFYYRAFAYFKHSSDKFNIQVLTCIIEIECSNEYQLSYLLRATKPMPSTWHIQFTYLRAYTLYKIFKFSCFSPAPCYSTQLGSWIIRMCSAICVRNLSASTFGPHFSANIHMSFSWNHPVSFHSNWRSSVFDPRTPSFTYRFGICLLHFLNFKSNSSGNSARHF